MKRCCALESLFLVLLAGCGPFIALDDESDSGTGTSGETTSLTDPTASTESSSTSVADVTTTDDSDTCADGQTCGGCWDELALYDVPSIVLEAWLDEDGQIPPQHCEEACGAAAAHADDEYEFSSVESCQVVGADGPNDTDTATSDGDSSDTLMSSSGSGDDTTGSDGDTSGSGSDTGAASTTGGSTGGPEATEVTLECELTVCGVGRGHEALQSRAVATGVDPVGDWAAIAAHAEAASVGSFLALNRELAHHGAPESLLARALEAARDEVAHAAMMRRIARRRGVTPTKPCFGPPASRTLEAFAVENAIEGCVFETWSALEATHQARAASDADVRLAMQRIARDETRHAELAHDIDAWLQERLDPDARARVQLAREAAVDRLEQQLEQRRDAVLQARAGLPAPHVARTLVQGLRTTLWGHQRDELVDVQ